MDEKRIQLLQEELSKFADPGSDPLVIQQEGDKLVVILTRNGSVLTLASDDFYKSPIVLTEPDGGERKFATYRSLLASSLFSDLLLWAKRQKDVLSAKADETTQIQPHGQLEPVNRAVENFDQIESEIRSLRDDSAQVRILLLDGPAGVGKTYLIERLALAAAQEFTIQGARLYLHVRSRGKVLSNIEDLMASSLQALRLNVTFDQVPVLVRHGLVVLAVDGFDELGDPEGYGHAWGQINELIDSVKGDGLIVLAGRETFIGRERLLRSVQSLAKDSSVVELTLDETPPHRAEQWLKDFEVGDGAIESLKNSGLLDRGSFALRPFFLSYLARDIRDGGSWLEHYDRVSDVLPIVVNAMVDREVRRFSGEVTASLSEAGVRDFVLRFLSEVAREMAGDQSESIAETMLVWIVEVSLPAGTEPKIVSLLKARAAAMAFLALDDRPGYRRFGHSQFFNYFLSRSVIDSIHEGDVPKWLRRGSVGPDFLVAFVPFLRVENAIHRDQVVAFLGRLSELTGENRLAQEGPQLTKNLAAIGFATLSLSGSGQSVVVCAPEIQYAYAGAGTFEGDVSVDFVHMLDARSCDFGGIKFNGTRVGTVLVDGVTRFGHSRPAISAVRFQSEDGAAIDYFDPSQVDRELEKFLPQDSSKYDKSSDALVLLDRLARSRRYWFKPEGDDIFGNFDELPGWQELKTALEGTSMIRVDHNRQVSGTKADWIHLKNARAILLRDVRDPKVEALLREIGWSSGQ